MKFLENKIHKLSKINKVIQIIKTPTKIMSKNNKNCKGKARYSRIFYK